MGNWAVSVIHIPTAKAPVPLIEASLLSKVNLCRRQIVQGLVDSPVIVEVEVPGQVVPGFFGMSVVMQIDFFVLHGTPEAFGEDVIERAALTIHADLDLRLL